MFTGKIVWIVIATLLAAGGVGGYFAITATTADDARYQAERAADIAAMREAIKHTAPLSPTGGR